MTDPIVFLPGYLCDQRLFCAQTFDLSRDHMVIQAPLIGERCEEMASALIPHLPRRFALVGASLGGIVALEILRKAPDRVARVCLVSTDALPDAPNVAADREPLLVQARIGRMDEAVRAALPAGALAPGPGRMATQELFAEMAGPFGAGAFEVQTRAMQRRRDHQSSLYRAQCPIRIIAGAHDTLVTPKRQEFMAGLAPTARFDCLDTAGHLPSLEDPHAVTAILRDWLHPAAAAA
ncbi:hydrolase, alpha/beta fold family protein [Pseudooceanicola batsensis HTCC2597]|uniref:Hydrolase, alpha/beta fold family protein n=1 Tax=Pseudooceanicola batsensis (strain ATCC BAA-863 / DSM 15984 / KCTC 12145 / HTCC2597) TaxID=252305 RepID=A3TYZ7_PSEBH|nr:alpha/beta hydrolase [Pseudooceanicola batsensis]EAQ02815.1 hydrolase, alpha/beta fold family protein [Pseudooceanicola batsensis HTCC2597]